MTVSVIIPNYNNAKFIDKCLNSVVAQTRIPDEIIVVDDFSTDNSADIIKVFENKYPMIKGIYLTTNGGVSHARNVGIVAASSEYITTLDADDFYYNKDKIKNELEVLKLHPESLVYSKLEFVNENDDLIKYADYPLKDYLQGEICYKLLSRPHKSIIIRDYCFPKSVLERSGLYDESSSLFEDFDFLIRICHYIPAYCTFECGTAYRIKAFGLSHKPQKVIYSTKQKIFDKYIKLLPYPYKIKVYVSNRVMSIALRIRNLLKG